MIDHIRKFSRKEKNEIQNSAGHGDLTGISRQGIEGPFH